MSGRLVRKAWLVRDCAVARPGTETEILPAVTRLLQYSLFSIYTRYNCIMTYSSLHIGWHERQVHGGRMPLAFANCLALLWYSTYCRLLQSRVRVRHDVSRPHIPAVSQATIARYSPRLLPPASTSSLKPHRFPRFLPLLKH